MTLELFVWAILFMITSGIVLVLNYWFKLFQAKDEYRREEILDFVTILRTELEILTARGEPLLNYAGLGLGVATAWLLTWFGGLMSPDASALTPDHAENQMPNYFFQSVLFLMMLHFVWPSLKEVAVDRMGVGGLASRALEAELPYFFGLASALGAINVTVWGVFHEMSFLFCAINMLLCLVYAGYRLSQAEEDYAPPGEDSEY
jgi:hypothetical protein